VSRSLAVFTPLWLEARAVRPALPGAEIVRCGVGPKRAQACAQALAERLTGESALAVAGVCGSLDARFAPGDVIVASELRGAGAPRLLASAKPLARALEAQGTRVHIGPILSVDHGVHAAERESLAATGAIAVDMESAWLAELANVAPFAVLRVVSDGPGQELFSPRIVRNGLRALRALRAAAPALALWARNSNHSLEAHPSCPSP
jgi:4-hydroxy-3-methylbut-2-enyl diphosphate reductase